MLPCYSYLRIVHLASRIEYSMDRAVGIAGQRRTREWVDSGAWESTLWMDVEGWCAQT